MYHRNSLWRRVVGAAALVWPAASFSVHSDRKMVTSYCSVTVRICVVCNPGALFLDPATAKANCVRWHRNWSWFGYVAYHVWSATIRAGVPRIQFNFLALDPFAIGLAEFQSGYANEPVRRRKDHWNQWQQMMIGIDAKHSKCLARYVWIGQAPSFDYRSNFIALRSEMIKQFFLLLFSNETRTTTHLVLELWFELFCRS